MNILGGGDPLILFGCLVLGGPRRRVYLVRAREMFVENTQKILGNTWTLKEPPASCTLSPSRSSTLK